VKPKDNFISLNSEYPQKRLCKN